MARQLTQTLTLTKSLNLKPNFNFAPIFSRNFSSSKAQLVEIDLQSSSSSSSAAGEIEVIAGLHLLEEAIHGIIVRRLQPDWLPFRPGSSYWVPPRASVAGNLMQLVGNLTNPLTPEESLSLVSAHGWPSSSYFIDQGFPPMVDMHLFSPTSENESSSEDED